MLKVAISHGVKAVHAVWRSLIIRRAIPNNEYREMCADMLVSRSVYRKTLNALELNLGSILRTSFC